MVEASRRLRPATAILKSHLAWRPQWLPHSNAMKRKLVQLAIALLSVTFTTTGCISHYRSVAWSSPFLSDTGTAYVMSGTQTLKSATLFTVHGTFKDFTFPVKREFTLFEVNSEAKAIGKFKHMADDCSYSDYMYFPNTRTMIARDEAGRARFQNLTTKRVAVGRGYIISHGYPASRFSLVKTEPNDTHAFYMFDSFTGASRALGSRASDFIGDTWHVTLSVSQDGKLIRRAYIDLSRHDITISAWDLEEDQVSVQPRVISYGTYYREASVLLFDEVGAREFLVAALKPVNRDGTTLKSFAVSSDVVSETTLGEWRLPF